jgi:deoxyribose-phosphate aldolase
MAETIISNRISSKIEHTALLPSTTKKIIDRLCREAKELNFYSVVVFPVFVKRAKHNLADTKIKVCSVVGFPLGASIPNVKSYETLALLMEGPDEIDMVMNIPAFMDNEIYEVQKEIRTIVDHAHKKDVLVKVIIETCLLDDTQKVKAGKIALEAGADFIKTSTGFSKSGVRVQDITLLKESFGDRIKLKAAGGIKSAQFALDLIKAGADRLGTSSSVKIMMEAQEMDKKIARKKIKL